MNRPLRTVAVVGPDGAGKSAVVAALPGAVAVPTQTVYLGVNLFASDSMLPTTRLARRLKRRSGGGMTPPDTSVPTGQAADGQAASGTTSGERGILGSIVGGARRSLRLVAWMGEEWYRAVVVRRHVQAGKLVICDRHFVCDYYAADIAPRGGRPLLRRIHGWQLAHLYPRPDLVLVLDAPVEVLRARKQEDPVAVLAQRRADYLVLKDALPNVLVIDATQPLEVVVAEAAAAIAARHPGAARRDRATATQEAG